MDRGRLRVLCRLEQGSELGQSGRGGPEIRERLLATASPRTGGLGWQFFRGHRLDVPGARGMRCAQAEAGLVIELDLCLAPLCIAAVAGMREREIPSASVRDTE